MNKETVKLMAQVLTIIALVTFVARSAVRLNAMESRTEKVQSIEKNIQIINLYLKLQDSDLYERAENLAE